VGGDKKQHTRDHDHHHHHPLGWGRIWAFPLTCVPVEPHGDVHALGLGTQKEQSSGTEQCDHEGLCRPWALQEIEEKGVTWRFMCVNGYYSRRSRAKLVRGGIEKSIIAIAPPQRNKVPGKCAPRAMREGGARRRMDVVRIISNQSQSRTQGEERLD
jgi:hypothetical protein